MLNVIARTAAAIALCLAVSPSPAQRLVEWVSGLDKPVDITQDPTDDSRWFVLEQTRGAVRVIEDGELLETPLIEVDKSDFATRNWEQGLLGIALSPDYAESREFYLYYTQGDGATVLSRFTASGPRSADWGTEVELLRIEQPWGNHNGGCIRFGPDGYLYLGPGDGGAANDPRGNGQNPHTLLGTLLRIDVTGEPDPGLPYAIPDDNPFADGEDGAPEVWAYGMRNAWRFEFDSRGRLWIADVGQNRFEYVHVQPAGMGGLNYGWNEVEGNGAFKPGRAVGRRGSPNPPRLSRAEMLDRGYEPAAFEYEHHPTASITGGYFYEGEKLDWLRSRYICADFMSGRAWTFRVREMPSGRYRADDVIEISDQIAATFGGDPSMAISSFGRSNDGEELLVLDLKGGRVLKFE